MAKSIEQLMLEKMDQLLRVMTISVTPGSKAKQANRSLEPGRFSAKGHSQRASVVRLK